MAAGRWVTGGGFEELDAAAAAAGGRRAAAGVRSSTLLPGAWRQTAP